MKVNIFDGGEGGVANAFGPNAWAMFPRPDIIPDKEYKGPGQYGGAVTRRITSGPAAGYVSDGGDDAVMRYLKSATFAVGDQLRMIIIPRHWQLESVTIQVYRARDVFGVHTGQVHPLPQGTAPLNSTLPLTTPAGTATTFAVVLETPAFGAVTATELDLVTGLDASLELYRSVAVDAANQFSTVNRTLNVKIEALPSDITNWNFELTAMMRNVRDIGRPT